MLTKRVSKWVEEMKQIIPPLNKDLFSRSNEEKLADVTIALGLALTSQPVLALSAEVEIAGGQFLSTYSLYRSKYINERYPWYLVYTLASNLPGRLATWAFGLDASTELGSLKCGDEEKEIIDSIERFIKEYKGF